METTALLFADDETSKRYAPTLTTVGVKILSVKPLSCEHILAGIEALRSALKTNSYDALVVTSAKASIALSCILAEEPNVRLPEKVYAVGASTAKSLPEVLRSKCTGMDAGNAASLAELIISDSPSSVLFPCGDLALDILPKKLEEAGISLDRIEVYATRPNPNLEKELSDIMSKNDLPSAMVFFSPSGVDYVYEALTKLHFDFDDIKLIAIGPSTENRIVNHGLKVWRTATKPNPEGVAAAFLNK